MSSSSSFKINYLSRNVGNLKENGVFVTHRSAEHVFRKFNGLAMSYDVLRSLRAKGCRKIIIIFDDGNGEAKYSVTPEDFLNSDICYFDGADSQRVLTFDFLSKSNLRRWL